MNWTGGSGVFIYSNGAGIGTTNVGTQWLFIPPGQADSQVIGGLAAGIAYHVSLMCADVTGLSDSFDITVSGGALTSAFLTAPARAGGESSGALPFTTYGLNFTPTSATIMLSIQNLSGGAIAVDNVGLTSAVPEPGAWVWAAVALSGSAIHWVAQKRVNALTA